MPSRTLTALLLLGLASGALAQTPVTLKSAVVALTDDPALRAEVASVVSAHTNAIENRALIASDAGSKFIR